VGQPGQLGGQFAGDDALIRRIQDLERQMRELAAANILATAGINAVPNGIIVAGSETVNGPLTVNGVSAFNGSMTINGAAAITGTLSLPAGIIDNAALAAPVTPGSAGTSQSNFATSATATLYAQQSIPVPAGYTQCLVMNGVSGGAFNDTAGASSILVSSDINGISGAETATTSATNTYASASAFAIRTLTGLSGGTITVATKIRTSTAWSANAANIAATNALAIFLR